MKRDPQKHATVQAFRRTFRDVTLLVAFAFTCAAVFFPSLSGLVLLAIPFAIIALVVSLLVHEGEVTP